MRASYLGPEGTHTHEAAASCDLLAGWELVPESSIKGAFLALARGSVDAAVLPLENSLEGPVGPTLDALAGPDAEGVKIRREIVRDIRHSLLAKDAAAPEERGEAGRRVGSPPGGRAADERRIDAISGVVSHPQALAQCAESLRVRFPDAILEPALSTAEAALIAASREGWAALGTRAAGERAGLAVLEDDLSDEPGNRTRFIVLMREDERPTGRDRTSLVFGLERDRPGGLHDVLGELASRGINLSRIESRPTRRAFGEYWFFVDFEAHREEPNASEAIAAARARSGFFRLLGSYPRCAKRE